MSLFQVLARGIHGAFIRLRRAGIAVRDRSKSRAPDSSRDRSKIGGHLSSMVTNVRKRLTPAAHAGAASASVLGVSTAGASDEDLAWNGGEFREFGFSCPAGSRQFKLYLPPAPPSRLMPLVVMLHGCTQTPDDFAAGTRMNEFARRRGFAVAYPAQSRIHNVASCWNWFRPADQIRGGGEPEIIAGLTRDLVERYGLDRERVYVAGLSAGGAMAAILGDAYPDIYAAVGIHSSVPQGVAVGLVSGLALMRHGRTEVAESDVPAADRLSNSGAPVIVFHGDADTMVHPRNAADVYARSTRRPEADRASRHSRLSETVESSVVENGRAFTRTRWIGPDAAAMSELWVVHESGHAWSGGDARGSFTDPRGPDASAEMLRFFFGHRLRGSR